MFTNLLESEALLCLEARTEQAEERLEFSLHGRRNVVQKILDPVAETPCVTVKRFPHTTLWSCTEKMILPPKGAVGGTAFPFRKRRPPPKVSFVKGRKCAKSTKALWL